MILRNTKYFYNVTKYDGSKLRQVHVLGTSETCSTIIFEALLEAMFCEVKGSVNFCGSVSPLRIVEEPAGF